MNNIETKCKPINQNKHIQRENLNDMLGDNE